MTLFDDDTVEAKVSRPDPDSLRFKPGATTEAVLGIATGYRVARGSFACTASKAVVTGLAMIRSVVVGVVGASTTTIRAAAAVQAKVQASTPGSFTAKRYKHTAPSTNTLIAATTAGTLHYIAVGEGGS